MIQKAITKNSLLLGIFALVVSTSLAITEISTHNLRRDSERQVKSQALEQIIPNEKRNNILLDDRIITNDSDLLHLQNEGYIHIARKDNQITAFILPTRAPDGYGGAIELIVGIYLDGTLAGVRIIKHQETPGLGDKIDLKKTKWILSFNNKSLENTQAEKWAVKKDKGIFDQFTGATITPRAIVNAIYKSLKFYKKYKKLLIEQAK